MKSRRINSVSSFIKSVFELRDEKISEYSLSSYWFFRGQKNSLWKMCPNVFRNGALAYEYDSIETALRQRPYDFRECTSDFEILTKLQHYGLGTRLLDVTLNPLVALYFASEKCDEYVKGKDGRGKYVPRDGKIVFRYGYGHKLSELDVRIACAIPFINFENDLTLSELLCILQENKIVTSDEATSFSNNEYDRFIQVIQRNSFVVSSHSNDRLIRQSGAFVIPSSIKIIPKTENIGSFLVRKSRCDLDEAFEPESFIIPACSKEAIREELDFLNINEATLFPELEHQLIYLQNRKLPEPGQVELYSKFNGSFDESISTTGASIGRKEPHPDVRKIVSDSIASYPDLIDPVIRTVTEKISIIDWWLKSSVISSISRDITRIMNSQMSISKSRSIANAIVNELLQ